MGENYNRSDTEITSSTLGDLKVNRAGEVRIPSDKESNASTEISYDVAALPVPHFVTQTDEKGKQVAGPDLDENDDIETIGTIHDDSNFCVRLMKKLCCVEIDPGMLSSFGSGPLLPNVSPKNRNKPCLVLDLDETLVHSSFMPVNNADFKLELNLEGRPYTIYVIKRPGLEEFMVEMSKHYELVLFTASVSQYARAVLSVIDKEGLLDHHLFREHCTFYQGSFVKDLRRLNRTLDKTIIVDNSNLCFQWQPDNAIGINSFINDKTDRELVYCKDYLTSVKDSKDFRKVLKGYHKYIDKRYREEFGSGDMSDKFSLSQPE